MMKINNSGGEYLEGMKGDIYENITEWKKYAHSSIVIVYEYIWNLPEVKIEYCVSRRRMLLTERIGLLRNPGQHNCDVVIVVVPLYTHIYVYIKYIKVYIYIFRQNNQKAK